MGNPHIKIKDLSRNLSLDIAAGSSGIEGEVANSSINTGGLELAGYYEFLDSTKIMVLGRPEVSFLRNLSRDVRRLRLTQLMFFPIPAIIMTDGIMPKKDFKSIADERQVPVLCSDKAKERLVEELTRHLCDMAMPSTTIHGGLLEVYGIGVLLRGKSGIGKSECALELVKRGHRLVVDDIVFIKKNDGNSLIGRPDSLSRYHMEIRGLGIINIKDLFGIGAISDSKKVELIVNLEELQANKEYDRLGVDSSSTEILGVEVPTVTIPVRHGKNTSIIVEVAAMNHHLKEHGHHSAKRFMEMLTNRISGASPQDHTSPETS